MALTVIESDIGEVEINVTITESPEINNTITEKPVEDGSVISDNIQNEPLMLSLNECVITGEEAADKLDMLYEISNEKELCTITGALQTYEDMAIENINIIKEADISNGYMLDIVFKQIRTAEPATIQITLGVDPVTGESPQDESTDIDNRDKDDLDFDSDTGDDDAKKTTLKRITDKSGELADDFFDLFEDTEEPPNGGGTE